MNGVNNDFFTKIDAFSINLNRKFCSDLGVFHILIKFAL